MPKELGLVKLSGIRSWGTIDLSEWNLKLLEITDSEIHGKIEGKFSKIDRVSLDRTVVHGRVDFRGGQFGEVSLIDAQVNGSLHLGVGVKGDSAQPCRVTRANGAANGVPPRAEPDPNDARPIPTLRSESPSNVPPEPKKAEPSVNLNGLRITGMVSLGGLEADSVSMVHARVGESVSFRRGNRKTEPETVGEVPKIRTLIHGDIDLHGIQVEGYVTLRGARVTGKVIITSAKIGGTFSCRPLPYREEREDPNALTFDGVPKDANVSQEAVPSYIGKGVFAARATIGGTFDISGSHIGGPVDLAYATVGGILAEPRVYDEQSPITDGEIDKLLWFIEGKHKWWSKVKVSEACDVRLRCCDLFRQRFSENPTNIDDKIKRLALKELSPGDLKMEPIRSVILYPEPSAKEDYLNARKGQEASASGKESEEPPDDSTKSSASTQPQSPASGDKAKGLWKDTEHRIELGLKILPYGWVEFSQRDLNVLRAKDPSDKEYRPWKGFEWNSDDPLDGPPPNAVGQESIRIEEYLHNIEKYLDDLPKLLTSSPIVAERTSEKPVLPVDHCVRRVHACVVEGGLTLDGAEIVSSVRIEGAYLGNALSAQLANVGGHFILRGWTLPLPESDRSYKTLIPCCVRRGEETVSKRNLSVQAEGIRVGGYVSLSGSVFESGINMLGAKIGGSLFSDVNQGFRTLVGATEYDETRYSLCLSGASIGSNIQIGGSYMARGLVLENATVSGDILATSDWIRKPDEDDSSECRTYVGGAKWLDHQNASLLFSNLTCNGDLDFRGSYLTHGLVMNEAVVRGSCYFGFVDRKTKDRPHESFMVTYMGAATDMSRSSFSLIAVGARIGGNVECSGGHFQSGVRLSLSEIGGHLYLNAQKADNPAFLLRTFFGDGRGTAAESFRDQANVAEGRPREGEGATRSAAFSNSSLMAMRVSIKGHVYCEGAVFTSGIDLSDSTIGGSFNASSFRGSHHQVSPIVDQGEIVRTFVGIGERFRSHYMLRMPRTRIGGSVDLTGLYFRGWLKEDLDTLDKPLLILDLSESEVRGNLSLVDDRDRFSLYVLQPQPPTPPPPGKADDDAENIDFKNRHITLRKAAKALKSAFDNLRSTLCKAPEVPRGNCEAPPKGDEDARNKLPEIVFAKIKSIRDLKQTGQLDFRNVKCDQFAVYRGRVDLYKSIRKMETQEGPKIERWLKAAVYFYSLGAVLVFLFPLSLLTAKVNGHSLWEALAPSLLVLGLASLIGGLFCSYEHLQHSPVPGATEEDQGSGSKGRRRLARFYHVSGIRCSDYHFADTRELSSLEVAQDRAQAKNSDVDDIRILWRQLRLQRPAGHGSEFPALHGYSWITCVLIWFSILVAYYSVFPMRPGSQTKLWVAILCGTGLLTFLSMRLFPFLRQKMESDELTKREYSSIFRFWFLGRCVPTEDVYRSIESMLINQGRRREADLVCHSWHSRNCWSDPLGSIFDMAAHFFIRHGLRVREILLLYGTIFFLGLAVFSNPDNLTDAPKVQGADRVDGKSVAPVATSPLRNGLGVTLLTLFPFGGLGEAEQSGGPDPKDGTLPNASHGVPKPKGDRQAKLTLVQDEVTCELSITPAEVRLWMRVLGLLLVPFLLPSIQRAVPRLRDRRAN